jgi:hypothetical protein
MIFQQKNKRIVERVYQDDKARFKMITEGKEWFTARPLCNISKSEYIQIKRYVDKTAQLPEAIEQMNYIARQYNLTGGDAFALMELIRFSQQPITVVEMQQRLKTAANYRNLVKALKKVEYLNKLGKS